MTRNRPLMTWIAEDCPNHQEGGCRGANLGPDWKLYGLPKETRFCNPLARCLVTDNLPCRFWEMGMDQAQERHPELRDAIREYRRRISDWQKRNPPGHPFCRSMVGTSGPVRDLRECPECRRPLLPRKRLCAACLRLGQRQRRLRSKSVMLSSAGSANNAAEMPAKAPGSPATAISPP